MHLIFSSPSNAPQKPVQPSQDALDAQDAQQIQSSMPGDVPAPAPRKRGRPRKIQPDVQSAPAAVPPVAAPAPQAPAAAYHAPSEPQPVPASPTPMTAPHPMTAAPAAPQVPAMGADIPDAPFMRHRGRPRKEDTQVRAMQPRIFSSGPAAAPVQHDAADAPRAAGQQPLRRAVGFRAGNNYPPQGSTSYAPQNAPRPQQNRYAAPQQAPQQPQRQQAAYTQPANSPNTRQRNSFGPQQNANTSKWRDKNNNRRRQDADRYDNDFDDDAMVGNSNDYAGHQILDLMELQKLRVADLVRQAQEYGLDGVGSMNRHELFFELVRQVASDPSIVLRGGGVLEIMPGGHGFLRSSIYSYLSCPEDIYVHPSIVRRWNMRTGDTIIGQVRQPREKERYFILNKVDSINDNNPDKKREIIPFENLTPYFPTQRILLEHDKNDLSTRIIDMITPIGRGQRGLIVAAPRTGKTVIMQKMANAIVQNNPDVKLIVLLIDERPEEVTDMMRVVKGEVVSSTFDEPPDRHVQVAEMVIEKAKRLVEYGEHVVILLDSITRLARAYNTVEPHSGRILTGGVDANALHKPKHFFGAARNIEDGGSLTILATALVETGSKMDDVIFEEFKGTGNMELNLDRSLTERRVYPAINLAKSGTRREELLVDPHELKCMWNLRKAMLALPPADAMEILISKLKKVQSNALFLIPLENMQDVDGSTLASEDNDR